MNYKIIDEIEKKRKKFFKNIFICFAILSLVSYFLAMFGFSEYFERYFWSSIIFANIPLLPLWISIPIVLRWQAREEISAMALAAVCEQFTGFKFVPPFNSKNKYYDTIKKIR